jgi:hypothetical protein
VRGRSEGTCVWARALGLPPSLRRGTRAVVGARCPPWTLPWWGSERRTWAVSWATRMRGWTRAIWQVTAASNPKRTDGSVRLLGAPFKPGEHTRGWRSHRVGGRGGGGAVAGQRRPRSRRVRVGGEGLGRGAAAAAVVCCGEHSGSIRPCARSAARGWSTHRVSMCIHTSRVFSTKDPLKIRHFCDGALRRLVALSLALSHAVPLERGEAAHLALLAAGGGEVCTDAGLEVPGAAAYTAGDAERVGE